MSLIISCCFSRSETHHENTGTLQEDRERPAVAEAERNIFRGSGVACDEDAEELSFTSSANINRRLQHRSEVATLAEKVVAKLEEYNTELSFFPEFELRDLGEMRVVVVPAGIQYKTLSLSFSQGVAPWLNRYLQAWQCRRTAGTFEFR